MPTKPDDYRPINKRKLINALGELAGLIIEIDKRLDRLEKLHLNHLPEPSDTEEDPIQIKFEI